LEIKIRKQKLKFYFGQKNPKLKIIHSKKKNPEKRLLCFGNENLKTKMKNPFQIKESVI